MKNNQGSIIVMCLVITTAVLILLGVFLGSVVAERRNVERSFRRAQAIHVAEAGVERGIWDKNQDPPLWTGWSNIAGSPDSKTITLGATNFDNVGECTITVSGASSSSNSIISATGYVPSITSSHRTDRAVRVTLASVSDSPFKYALFADEGPLKMLGWSSTDSYDSKNGPYSDPGNKGYEGNIGTNSTGDDDVVIKPGAMVEGNVIVGPGGNPADVIFNQGTISGDTVANAEEETMPSISPPTGLPFNGDLTVPGTWTISASGAYGTITIGNGDKLILEGDIILSLDTLDMKNGSQLEIATGASVVMYVMGTGPPDPLSIDNAGIVNLDSDPLALTILCPNATSIKLHNSSNFYGTLYAPEAHVDIKSNAQFYGSLVANSITQQGSGAVHYDVALLEAGLFDDIFESTFQVASWREL